MSGFFYLEKNKSKQRSKARQSLNVDMCHSMQCSACPLDGTVKHQGLGAVGVEDPLIYILGKCPGVVENQSGKQFAGPASVILRESLPNGAENLCRFNNIVRTPVVDPKTTVDWTAIESCRPSVVKDIERTKPKAIFSLGSAATNWASLLPTNIDLLRGRHMPVKVGNHVCWLFPVYDPSFILRKGKFHQRALPSELRKFKKTGPWKTNPYLIDEGRVFTRDLKRAYKLAKTLPDATVEDINRLDDGVTYITGGEEGDLKRVKEFLQTMLVEESVAIDYETNGLRPYAKGAKILSVAIGTGTNTLAFALDHRKNRWPHVDRRAAHAAVNDFFTGYKGRVIAMSAAFEQEWTAWKYGADLLRYVYWDDIQVQAYVLDSRFRGLSLDFITMVRFGFRIKEYDGVDVRNLDNEPLIKVLKYNGRDTKYTYKAFFEQEKDIVRHKMQGIYAEQMKRIPTMVLTQRKGIVTCQKTVRSAKNKLEDEITEIELNISQMRDVKDWESKNKFFNPGSPDDAISFFMTDYRDALLVRGKDGEGAKYSADAEHLGGIDHPLAEMIISYRKAKKNLSTYVQPLMVGSQPCYVYPDGLVHTSLNTIWTVTGRLSSDTPNMQNQPSRRDAWIRRCFVAPPGHQFLKADYGQLEARVIAMFSEDPHMIELLLNNYDIHMYWAIRLATDYPECIGGRKFLDDKAVMKEFRTHVKSSFVFSSFYGSHPTTVARDSMVPLRVAEVALDDFWSDFAEVKKWQQRVLDTYNKKGYVECLTGRRRAAPLEFNKIINTGVQGTASDIVVDSMNRLSEYAEFNDIPSLQPILNVHDELDFYTPDVRLDDDFNTIVDYMLDVPYDWASKVPVSVELGIGPNWCDLETIGEYHSHEQ